MKAICLLFFLLAISPSFGQNSLRSPTYVFEASIVTIQDSHTDMLNFAKGFFQGIGGTRVFDEIQSCLVDSEQVLLDLGIGIQDLQTKDPEKIREGIQRIGQAIQAIPEAAQLCQVADKDIQKIIKIIRTFTHPVSLIYHAEKSLLINHVEVFQEIMHVIDSYQKKDYTELGYWTGKAMVTIFLKSPYRVADTRTDTINFVKGFLDGIGATTVFNEIQGCLVDSEKTLMDIGIGIQDLASGNLEKIIEGIHLIGEAAKMIPEAATLCKAADADIKRLIKLIRTFTNPISIVYHAGKSLMIDWVDILEETMGAIAAYKKQDYKDLGYWIGRAMATIFLKSPLNLRDASAETLDFVQGLLEGAGNAVSFDQRKEDPLSLLYEAGKSMIMNQEEVMSEVDNAVAALKEENLSQLGYWIGKAMETILLGKEQEKPQEDFKALEYIEG